ncbi:hypothetical protein [Tunturiibacter gelidoferens]|uniref:Uncharacterized protein n=1 Tax=Tunturiibacter lichenicola TaxID=2051959 RepID=A0A7Y9T2E8_9BACT|nr:hypothetical protein [Edaphobacter lichenicola]NYF51101.1 hypothetical protein [Edaphobacter lichenicola]
MADTANDTFAGLPADEKKREATISQWYSYEKTQQGRDRYPASGTPCDRSFQNGYLGRLYANEIFEDTALVPHFTNRFLKMAQYLKSFPALGALEMFNEPNFVETHKPGFARTIAQIRKSLYERDPSLRAIPLYSGVAAWDEAIAKNLEAVGDLALEPYINVHSYAKAEADPQVVQQGIEKTVAYLRRVAPNKQVVIAEAGVSDAIYDLNRHEEFFNAFLNGKVAAHAGIWMWGTFADDAIPQPNFKWEYNSTALSGGAYRNLLIATQVEDTYRRGKPAEFTGAVLHKAHTEPVTINQIGEQDANPLWRLRWQITVGPEHFVSISRAGILTRVAAAMRGVLSDPGSIVAIDAAANKSAWAEIVAHGNGWEMNIYQCATAGSNAPTAPTPPYVIEYAGRLGRADFKTCSQSSLVDRGLL